MGTTLTNSRQIATTVSGTGAVSILPASGNSLIYRDLVGITISTTNAAAAGTLTLSDGTRTAMVIDYPNTSTAAPQAPIDFDFDPPLQQSVANQAWTITASANAGNYHVNAQYIER
jgi:hypothetical protein